MLQIPTERHVKLHTEYLKSILSRKLPMASLDTTRMTLVFFAISGLDILDQLESSLNEETRSRIIEWIYAQQISHSNGKPGVLGFRGSPANGTGHEYDFANLGTTYAAIASLVTLGDDLSRVNVESLRKIKRDLQGEDGCIYGSPDSEGDMRYVYCSCAVAYMLDDWSIIDVEKTEKFIKSCFTYENAFGQRPGCEAHGGSTFCAVASLSLMGKLESALTQKEKDLLVRWLLLKQENGFSGRPNKDNDTCYSFWIGGTLKLLGCFHLINHNENVNFIQLCTNLAIGGIAKCPCNPPDPLHTFLALSGLHLEKMDARINVTQTSLCKLTDKRARK